MVLLKVCCYDVNKPLWLSDSDSNFQAKGSGLNTVYLTVTSVAMRPNSHRMP